MGKLKIFKKKKNQDKNKICTHLKLVAFVIMVIIIKVLQHPALKRGTLLLLKKTSYKTKMRKLINICYQQVYEWD